MQFGHGKRERGRAKKAIQVEKTNQWREKENDLDDADCQSWPGFQAGSPSLHHFMSGSRG